VSARDTVLFLSQVYAPDPASVGQHMTDAAEEMARRGHRVVVLTANSGYDDPSRKYPARERRNGVDVIRLPFSSFGKSSILARTLGGLLFLSMAVFRALTVRGITRVVATTSPPMGALGALAIRWLTGASIVYWVMDINPDQIVAMGGMSPTALPVRLFDWINRAILRQADDVVVLDRYMEQRMRAKGPIRGRLHVMPPWPLEDFADPLRHEDNPWRAQHMAPGTIAIMYSGNHSPSNPLTTVLAAARRVVDEPRLQFYFVGGGQGKAEVEAAGLPNVHSLPYQPLDTLRFSLSSADVHVVTMGDEVVGIVHPCKIYGAMAVGRPILAVGPTHSHIGELITEGAIGWQAPHGDVVSLERTLRDLAQLPADQLERELHDRGARAGAIVRGRLGREMLRAAFCNVIDGGKGDAAGASLSAYLPSATAS
jgi:colanic acid biosynthesis glycosyl transferase WcaI